MQRNDRAEKLKQRRLNDETVVKCSLNGLILQNQELVHRAIDSRVQACSRRTFAASLAFNYMVREWFHNQEDLANVVVPDFFEQTFQRQLLLGVARAVDPIPSISSFLANHPEFVLTIERHSADRNIYSAAAKHLVTGVKNHLILNFDRVLKKYLYNSLEKEEAIAALYQFFGWKQKALPKEKPAKRKSKLSDDEKAQKEAEEMLKRAEESEERKRRIDQVVNNVRTVLSLPEGTLVGKAWFKKDDSLKSILRMFVMVNRFVEQKKQQDPNLKNFSILPVCGLRPHFITIDTHSLFGVMEDAELVSGKQSVFLEQGPLQWSTFLKIAKVQGKDKTFTGTIDTDGVSVCLHFTRPKKQAKGEEKQHIGKRVLGVDPGRTNILFVVEEIAPNKFKHYRLTRNQYYNESGVITARKHTEHWHNNISNELKLLSTVSTKSASLESFQAFLQVVFQVKEAMWKEYFKKHWMQQRLRLYGGKKRVFSKFLNKIDSSNEKTVLAFGSAKFAPGGKNEVSVPTTRAFKECSYRFPIVLIDEFRTSKIHWRYDTLLDQVAKKNDSGSLEAVRGLLWCSSTIQNNNKFVNRDLNAAINIRRCAILPNRPSILTRGSVIEKQRIGRII